MLKIRLFIVGEMPRGAYTDIRNALIKQLIPYVQLEEIVTKQTDAFAKHLSSQTFGIVLDEQGSTFSSISFASYLKALEDTGRHIDVFLGDAFGIPQSMKESADLRLSLSPMTITHDLAHILFLEQLYRACTINKGKKYHY